MALQLQLAVVLLSNLRAGIAIVGFLFCAYVAWHMFRSRKVTKPPDVAIWSVIVVAGICLALLGRWGRVATLAILLVLMLLLVRVIARRH